jgi:hypothetical protein
MAGNRKAAEAVIHQWVAEIDPSGRNTKMYKELFANMTDKQFDEWMTAIGQGKDFVSMVADNFTDKAISIDNNVKVAKKMGVELFHRLWLTDEATGKAYLTPKKYLTMHLPVRRQIQTLVNKISIPEDNRHVDELTDQPVGVSKGSSMSLPETLTLLAHGMDKGIEEMLKFRGGDLKAMNAMDKEIINSGGVKMETISKLGTRVKSTETFATMLKAMHLDNTY